MRKLFVILLPLLLPFSAFATSYFVTQSGAGSKDGTSSSNAWPVGSFNSSRVPTGGDTVFFSGAFTSGVNPGSSGTSANRLTLDFTAATLNSGGISLSSVSYLTVNGGTFGSSNTGTLIDFAGAQSHDVTINGWTYAGPAGGTTDFLSLNYCYNLTVSGNHVSNIAHLIGGDSTLNHDLLILNNYAMTSNNQRVQTDVITIGDAANVTIQGNKLINQAPGATSNDHNDCIQTYTKGGGNAGAPTNWIVRYNWIEMQQNSGSGDNSWLMIENLGGNPAMQLYGNVFVGSGSVGNNGCCFNSENSSAVIYYYNNTIIRHASPDNTIRFLAPGTLYARNNVGMADPAADGTFLVWQFSKGATWNNNYFYQFDDATATQAGTNGSVSTNPLFTNYAGNDFSLQSSSPLRGAGDNTIGTQYSQGIAQGATWPNPTLVPRTTWDVGAFQTTVTPLQVQGFRFSMLEGTSRLLVDDLLDTVVGQD